MDIANERFGVKDYSSDGTKPTPLQTVGIFRSTHSEYTQNSVKGFSMGYGFSSVHNHKNSDDESLRALSF